MKTVAARFKFTYDNTLTGHASTSRRERRSDNKGSNSIRKVFAQLLGYGSFAALALFASYNENNLLGSVVVIVVFVHLFVCFCVVVLFLFFVVVVFVVILGGLRPVISGQVSKDISLYVCVCMCVCVCVCVCVCFVCERERERERERVLPM